MSSQYDPPWCLICGGTFDVHGYCTKEGCPASVRDAVVKTPDFNKYAFCDHKWVDAGFRHEKLVCAYCNIDKPKI